MLFKMSTWCFDCTFSVLQASSKRQHHLNKHLYRPSTFLTSYEPPVYMDEDDERSAYYSSIQDPSADDSVSLLSSHNTNYWKPQRRYLYFYTCFFLYTSNLCFVIDPIPLTTPYVSSDLKDKDWLKLHVMCFWELVLYLTSSFKSISDT